MGEALPMNTPAQVAAKLARAGFPVFPCSHDKRPLTQHGFKDATAVLSEVEAYWRQHPSALIGLPTGAASGVFVIDLDIDKSTGEPLGESSLAALGFSDLKDRVPSVLTPSGGLHLYFRATGLPSTAKKLGAGIDTRGNGGYVIAPGSVGPSGAYVARGGPICPASLPDLPSALLDALRGQPQPALQIETGPSLWRDTDARADLGEVQEVLSHIPADCSYGDWVAVLMGLHDHFSGAQTGLDIADQWSAGGRKYKPGEVAEKWRSFKPGGGTGWGSVCNLARQCGADLSGIARRHKGRETTFANQEIQAPRQSVPDHSETDRHQYRRLERAKWCTDLACQTLEESPDWEGVLAYDEFAGLTMLLRPVPGTTTPRATFKPRPIRDTDFTATVRWFNRYGYPEAKRNTVIDAVYLVAGQNVISPVKNYLESLKWDGVPRVADWLIVYCGAETSDLTRKVGQAWLISAVARQLNPGCKADCALILEGKQGAGKSAILRTLAGEHWFHDGLQDMHGKDASAALKGKWIIELPELSAMRKSDTEAVKAFLSRTEERYRPAYGRSEVIEPRRCVFAGTTNRSDYITDETGGRRFWPVIVGEVHLVDLSRDREQIWAEAVNLYLSGAPWWLDQDAEKDAAAIVADRAADDPWSADVLAAVEGLSETGTRQVLQHLNLPPDRWTTSESMRIASILTRAGWKKAGRFSAGVFRGQTCYIPPNDM